MARGPFRLFAGRRITLTGVLVTIATVVVAFGVGIAAGWATSLIASNLSAPEPTDTGTASGSPSPTPSMTPSGDVSVPPMEPVTREIDDDDKAAGLRTLDFPYQADGTFTPVPVKTQATPPPVAHATSKRARMRGLLLRSTATPMRQGTMPAARAM